MKVNCIWEHNGNDSLLYAENCIGAFTRGESLAIALQKMPEEIRSYHSWMGTAELDTIEPVIIQEKESNLEIKDADSDVLFVTEEESLTYEEYVQLKEIALKSAEDFFRLYNAIPDKETSCLPMRKTFYGQIPRTAEEMYLHTKNVNCYYFAEIGVDADNDGDIVECRIRGFEKLEKSTEFLSNLLQEGSYGEMWSVRKMLRRFIWHDRIHAKAMWRMAKKTFGEDAVENVFRF